MQKLFDIRSALNSYSVMLETDVLASLSTQGRSAFAIADSYFANRLKTIGIPMIALEAGEDCKSFGSIEDVLVRMRESGVVRDTHLYGVGGGAVQDVAGFVASIYMRGLNWSYVPTTLLGMVDSCIGGKSSINVGRFKNIVGTFHPPSRVLIDKSLTSSLEPEQRVAGLVESAKICFCKGAEEFADLMGLLPGVDSSTDVFETLIKLSLNSKKWFVETDEFDRGERQLLNFGHTFGHALESASSFELSHGLAVGVGIICAISLGITLNKSGHGGDAESLEQYIRGLLVSLPRVKVVLGAIDPQVVLHHLGSDKKHTADSYRFVLVNFLGRPHIVSVKKDDCTNRTLECVVSRTLESLC